MSIFTLSEDEIQWFQYQERKIKIYLSRIDEGYYQCTWKYEARKALEELHGHPKYLAWSLMKYFKDEMKKQDDEEERLIDLLDE